MNDFYIGFATREQIYEPSEDLWDDNSRELIHEELAMPRLERWKLTAAGLDATEIYFMGVRQAEDR